MAKRVFTDNDYRKGFEAYLEALSDRDRIDLDFLETELIKVIQQNFDPTLESIFSVRDTNYFSNALRLLRRNDSTKGLFNGSDPRYPKGLKLLHAFYGSNHLPGRKLRSNPRKKEPEITSPSPTNPVIQHQSSPANDPKLYTEGARKELEMERAYRNPEARNECIRIWGAQCQVCGLKFKESYGEELGNGFIEIHHLIPISERPDVYEIDPTKDLVPLCSNCHSMIHRGKSTPLSLSELRVKYQGPTTPLDNPMNL